MTRFIKLLVVTTVVIGGVFLLFHFRETNRFDLEAYDSGAAYRIAEDLASEELMGRGPGEPGNVLAQAYIEDYLDRHDIAYETETFVQLTPIIDPNGVITIGEDRFNLYDDFEFTISGNGSDLVYDGEILFVGESLYDIDPELLDGRIVVQRSNRITDDHADYLMTHGAAGILHYTNDEYFTTRFDRTKMDRKLLYIDDKVSSELFKGRITYEFAKYLMETARENQFDEYYRPPSKAYGSYSYERVVGLVKEVHVDVHVDYRLVELSNFIINFPGKDRTIANNLISRFDGQGLGNDTIGYFPSAVNGGASTAGLLELARTLNVQDEIPEEDINIVLVNGSNVSDKGMRGILELLSDRYEGNKNIALEYIGYTASKGARVLWDFYNNQAIIIGNKLFNYSMDLGTVYEFVDDPILDISNYRSYSGTDNPFVMITGTHKGELFQISESSEDTIEQVSEASLHNAMKIVLAYINKDLYRDMPLDFIDIRMLYALVVLSVFGLLGLFLKEGYQMSGNRTLGAIYYSRPYNFVALVFKYTLPFGVALLLIGMVLNIPPDFNMVKIGDATLTNFSLYEVVKGTYLSIINIFRTFSDPSSDIMVKLLVYIRKSLILIGLGLSLSLVIGIFKGILDSYSKKRGSSLKTLTSIFAYSVPDVLIAILALLVIINLSRIPLIDTLIGPRVLRTTIMPVVALIIIPSIYISRLVFVTLEEEKQKEYVKFLYYKGIPRRQVYFRQFTFVSVLKVLASMKAILMVIFSNLILVEYIFSYPGIMFNIITYKNNPYVIIIFALVIGVLFVTITGISKFILKIISPRREALS